MQSSPRILTIASNAVRVTHFAPSGGLPSDRPWIKDVLLPLPESEKSGSEIALRLENNLVHAYENGRNCFFREKRSPTLGIHKRHPYFYFDISQTALYAGMRKIDAGIRLHLATGPDESFYGWGEWFNAFERRSSTITLDNRNAMFDQQNHQTYSGLPFFISSKGYGFLLLNSHRSRWNISSAELTVEGDGPGADYILIYGPTIKEILRTYTGLTGRPPLLPRWGFGLWVTGYPQEHQDKVVELAQQHRNRRIPLDAVILDYHWEQRFHNFKWRRSLIPNPEALVKDLKTRGIKLGLILTSYLNTRNRPGQKWLLNLFGQNLSAGLEYDDERALEEFAQARASGFLAHENVRWWFGAGGMIDFANPAAAAWWQEKLSPLFETGADFIKNDDGEDLPDDACSSNGMDGREYHNIYGYYYGKATYQRPEIEESVDHAHPRSVIYARTFWVGSQRFPALFMGDQKAGFEGIRHGIRAGLNLALAGFSYWTADVFGLMGKTSPEIHMRYAQWSLLSPVARYFIRPEQIDDTRFPWSHNPQVENNFRKYVDLRMKLLPYFNTLAHESHMTGIPLMRPPMLEFENDARLRSVDDQIMLGGALLICPVIEQGAVSRKVVLPEGLWHDYWSENSWQGNTILDYPTPIDRLPLLVRGGTILPMGPLIQNIPDRHTFDHLELHLWPPYPAEGIFFDDDGYTTAYQHGEYSRTRMRAEKTDKNILIRISAVQGKFQGQVAVRKIELVIHRSPAITSARLNDEIIPHDNQPGSTQISFDHVIQQDASIELSFHP